MKKTLALIVLLGLCFAFKANKKKDEIIWSPDRNLTWNDFKNPLSKYAHESAIANTGITYKCLKPIDNLSTKVCVYAIFFKSLSSKSSETNFLSDELLEHEQGHFDIDEWYARIFRKELQDTSFASINQFYSVFLKRSRNNLDSANAEEEKYDNETNHSIDTVAQNRWNKYIAEQLNAYSAYSQAEFVITCGKK